MSGNKQRRFTDEFKREAVRLTETSGRSVERVSDDLGIAKSTLSRWRSERKQAHQLPITPSGRKCHRQIYRWVL
jgi:transposase